MFVSGRRVFHMTMDATRDFKFHNGPTRAHKGKHTKDLFFAFLDELLHSSRNSDCLCCGRLMLTTVLVDSHSSSSHRPSLPSFLLSSHLPRPLPLLPSQPLSPPSTEVSTQTQSLPMDPSPRRWDGPWEVRPTPVTQPLSSLTIQERPSLRVSLSRST
jgi:hypothetical protein